MASGLQEIQKELKKQIFNDYLSGMEIEEIRAKFGFKYARTVYYHFPPLTKKDKLTHMAAKARKMKKELQDEPQTSETKTE